MLPALFKTFQLSIVVMDWKQILFFLFYMFLFFHCTEGKLLWEYTVCTQHRFSSSFLLPPPRLAFIVKLFDWQHVPNFISEMWRMWWKEWGIVGVVVARKGWEGCNRRIYMLFDSLVAIPLHPRSIKVIEGVHYIKKGQVWPEKSKPGNDAKVHD